LLGGPGGPGRASNGQHGRQVINKLVFDNNKHITIIKSMTDRFDDFFFAVALQAGRFIGQIYQTNCCIVYVVV
jgi:hypothetical protein